MCRSANKVSELLARWPQKTFCITFFTETYISVLRLCQAAHFPAALAYQRSVTCLIKNVSGCLTISWHPNRQAFLEAAVLAPVAVHTHDLTVLVLYTHLVIDVLLDAAAEKPLKKKKEDRKKCMKLACEGSTLLNKFHFDDQWPILPCNPRMHALHSGNQMQCPRRLCKAGPFHPSLRRTNSQLH